ncbi:MAG: substrate-binding domain-containing protein [Christensenellales bacterium]
MKCFYCGFENEFGASFCVKCGQKMTSVCGNCGAALSAGNGFCTKCGFRAANTITPNPAAAKLPSKRGKAVWIISAGVFFAAIITVLLLLILNGTSVPASGGFFAARPQHFVFIAQDDGDDTGTLYLQNFSGGEKEKIAEEVQPDTVYDIAQFQSVAFINKDAELYVYKNGQLAEVDSEVTAFYPGWNLSCLTLFYEKDEDAYMYREGRETVELPFDFSELSSGTAYFSSGMSNVGIGASSLAFSVQQNSSYPILSYTYNEKGFLVYASGNLYFYDYNKGEKNKVISNANTVIGASENMNSIAYTKDSKLYILWDVTLDNPEAVKYSISNPKSVLFKNASEVFVLEDEAIAYISKDKEDITEIDLNNEVNSNLGISEDKTRLYFISGENDLYTLNLGGEIREDLKEERVTTDVYYAFQFKGDAGIFAYSSEDNGETIKRIEGGSKKTVKGLTSDYRIVNKDSAFGIGDDDELTVINIREGTKKSIADDVYKFRIISTAGNGMALFSTEDGDLYLLEDTTETKLDFDNEDVSRILCNFMEISIPEKAVPVPTAPVASQAPAATQAPAVATEEVKMMRLGFIGPVARYNLRVFLEGLEKYAAEYAIELVITDSSDFDQAKQSAIVENYIASGMDGILFYPDFSNPIPNTVIQEARAAGIATLAVADSQSMLGADYVLMGMNSFLFGKALGNRLAELVGYKGIVAVGYGAQNAYTQEMLGGVESAFSQYKDIQYVGTFLTNYDQAVAQANAADMIKKYTGMAGFLALDSISLPGIATAVDKAGLAKSVVTYGLHWMGNVSRADLEGSSLSRFMTEDWKNTGYAAGMLMSHIANGNTVYEGMDLKVPGFHNLHVDGTIISGENWVEIDSTNFSVYNYLQ